ncbi:LOW QUALITY PROTEIN: uncharacterized protein O3C94_004839 [Discoglossus pictus]
MTGGAIRRECYSFNEGVCKWVPNCRYRHVCSSCGGEHSELRCGKPKETSRQGEPSGKGNDAGITGRNAAMAKTLRSFLQWVSVQESGYNSMVHYLDDFLFSGALFGVPLADQKTEGPTTCLSFLGIFINSLTMECSLPLEKVNDLRGELAALAARRVSLRRLQSILGKLAFACRIIPMGRIFCRRIALATVGIKQPHHFARITASIREDAVVWVAFSGSFNGRALIHTCSQSNIQLALFTDASGAHGFGAYFRDKWCAAAWPEKWIEAGLTKNLAFLELFPIIVSVCMCGEDLKDRHVIFFSDNMAVVHAVNNITSSSIPVIRLLRHLVLACLRLNICFRAKHVPGIDNSIADALSRFQWGRFRQLAPQAAATGEQFPLTLWELGAESALVGPEIVLFHVGGNDLGYIPIKRLVRDMKRDISGWRERFPGIIVIWWEMVKRREWRNARVNKLGWISLRRHELEESNADAFFLEDGEHLTEIGLELLMLKFKEGVQRA